jgi:hypothetical protein
MEKSSQKAPLNDAVHLKDDDAAKHMDSSSTDANIVTETPDQASAAPQERSEPENVSSRRHYGENMYLEPEVLPPAEPSAAATAAAATLVGDVRSLRAAGIQANRLHSRNRFPRKLLVAEKKAVMPKGIQAALRRTGLAKQTGHSHSFQGQHPVQIYPQVKTAL